eukprot:3507264-Amphidinium_carterae.1
MVAPSSGKPSLARARSRTLSTSQRHCAATIVLLPDSIVSLSRWTILFTSVAKLASSNRQSAA